MYYLSFYEDGIYCCNIGAEIPTLQEAMNALDCMSRMLPDIQKKEDTFIMYNRSSTPCAVAITDMFGQLIKDQEPCT